MLRLESDWRSVVPESAFPALNEVVGPIRQAAQGELEDAVKIADSWKGGRPGTGPTLPTGSTFAMFLTEALMDVVGRGIDDPSEA